jgi:phosphoserine aminotransferase
VDVYYFAPQKVFASDGGLYIAILSPKAVERALRLQQDKSRYVPEYMKWSHAIENSRLNQTYNTPSIATIFLMNEQVKLMNKLGEDKVIAEAKRKADFMYGWAESKTYLNPFVREKSMRSHAVVTIDVDDRYKMDDLAAVLRAKSIVYDIEAYRKLNRNQLRIALFHNVSYDDLVKLTKIVSLAIESSN